MKLSIARADLLKALTRVAGVVSPRNTMPILANVKLTATKTALTIAATDMELSAVVLADNANVRAHGECTAPAALLLDIVKKLPAESDVTLEHAGERLTLKAGRYATAISTLPVDDFPAIDVGSLPHRFTMPVAALAGLLTRVAFAQSTEETRYYLNGIYLHIHADGTLRAAATDGHRLGLVHMPVPDGAGGMPGIILPRRAVAELTRLLVGSNDVDVALSDTRASFCIGGVTLSTKLIDGKFPEYDRVIPRGNDNIVTVQNADLIAAVGRVSALGDGKSRAVKISIAPGTLNVSVNTDTGSASEDIDVSYSGEPMHTGFQSRYVADIAAQIGDVIEMRLGDSASPVTLHDPADASVLFVLMPLRI